MPPPQTLPLIYLFTFTMLMLKLYTTALSRRSDSMVSGHEKMTVTKNLANNPQKLLQKIIHIEVTNDFR